MGPEDKSTTEGEPPGAAAATPPRLGPQAGGLFVFSELEQVAELCVAELRLTPVELMPVEDMARVFSKGEGGVIRPLLLEYLPRARPASQ